MERQTRLGRLRAVQKVAQPGAGVYRRGRGHSQVSRWMTREVSEGAVARDPVGGTVGQPGSGH